METQNEPSSQSPSPSSTKSRKSKKECTEKTPYKSLYKEGYITPANYIVELIFQKRNNHFNSGKAPESFWNQPGYQGIYRKELFGVNRLLSFYHDDSIIKALNSSECKYVLKISYARTWDDARFKRENAKLISSIEKFEKTRVETEMIKSEQKEEVAIAKPFSKNKNILKDL